MISPINYTHELIDLDPKKISMSLVSMSEVVKIQKEISKAVWRPAPGRKFGFMVFHDTQVIGTLSFASPVINLGVRDEYLNLPKDKSEKGRSLRQYVDMSVCVGLQPLAWYWNIGKLIASLGASRIVSDHYRRSYGDTLQGVLTTSLYGRGTQYNRVFRFLGYTKGYGHEHVSEDAYRAMLGWMKENDVPIPSCAFGAGSNPRMRRISAYNKARGLKNSLKHGKKRGVYYKPCENRSLEEVVDLWYNRWGKPRYERVKDETPPYRTGLE